MKKATMKAQLRYSRKEAGREGYTLNIQSDGEWTMDSFFPLFARENGDGEADFVHWSLLRKLHDLQELGYDIDFCC